MADEKRIATFEWLNDNLYEFRKGTPPINKKGVTKTELTTNYSVDESLLTSHTDKRLVTRQNCVGIGDELGLYSIASNAVIDVKNEKYVIISSNFNVKSEYYKINPKIKLSDSYMAMTDGKASSTTFYEASRGLGTATYYDIDVSGRGLVKTYDGDFFIINDNFRFSKIVCSNLMLSPDRTQSLTVWNNSTSNIYDHNAETEISKNYALKGYMFDIKNTYSTLSYRQNYPEETFTNTSYSILSKNNSYLVLENEGEKVRLSKITQDLSQVPVEMLAKASFIDDINKNSNFLKIDFVPGHTARTFTKDIDSFNFTDNQFSVDFIIQQVGGESAQNTNTKVFIRLGDTDVVTNYVEFETYIENFNTSTVKDWVSKSFTYDDSKKALDLRNSEGYSKFQRYRYEVNPLDTNEAIYVKGDPILSDIKIIMIGFRNISGTSTRSHILYTKSPMFKNMVGVKIQDVDVRRSEVKIYNKNIYPYIVSNQEGVELLPIWDGNSSLHTDKLGEITFKQEILVEKNISGLSQANLVTHRSNTEEAFVRMDFSNGDIKTTKTSNLDTYINEGADIRASSILSSTENMLIFNQATSDVETININGESRKMIGIVRNA